MINKDTSTNASIDTGLGTGAAPAMLRSRDRVTAKLIDAGIPGYLAEFDPDEAETAGAFVEDALSEADAIASVHDAANDADLSQAPRIRTFLRRH